MAYYLDAMLQISTNEKKIGKLTFWELTLWELTFWEVDILGIDILGVDILRLIPRIYLLAKYCTVQEFCLQI